MKKVFLSVFLLAGLSLAVVSCDNGAYDATPSIDKSKFTNPLNPPVNPAGNAKMSAIIDTTHWVSTYALGKYTNGGFTITGRSGISAQLQGITLSITTYNGPGTYPLNTYGNASYTLKNLVTNSTYGQVIVDTDANGIIEGRFFFQGTGVNISNGYFRVLK